MATIINDLKTWQDYSRFRVIVSNDWREKPNIPAEFQKYFESPMNITNLSHSLVRTILCEYGKCITTGIYDIDNDNKAIIDLVVRYLRRDEEFLKASPSFSFNKGLLLHGPVGTGKTVLFKTIRALINGISFYDPNKEARVAFMPGNFEIVSANAIVRRFSIDGNEIFMQDNADLIRKPLCIEDCGSEPEASHYGHKTNILAEILQERYDRKVLTHISTNLSMSAIKDAYGLRVFDRMKEMFNDIPLTGNSRRK